MNVQDAAIGFVSVYVQGMSIIRQSKRLGLWNSAFLQQEREGCICQDNPYYIHSILRLNYFFNHNISSMLLGSATYKCLGHVYFTYILYGSDFGLSGFGSFHTTGQQSSYR